ncbi:phosphoglucomutase (alpha-D-glucose-1,6-bisphosphate-dependent) [Aliiglaciecola sp. NS0011-25]|uniref:phosphoglucomutase (alpha-D-glucose-1,6-bisphosphate-dependent) n=1 Tax=Aliiglaciecola sp. NS0011-25 TaxID=3127654 RepID=UPI00310B792F
MTTHQHAGKQARPEDIINVARLVTDYYQYSPDVNIVEQRVSFGTSGHRGSASNHSFNEHHILAICQAVAEYRFSQGYQGPLYLGKDTHALSEPAFASALAVLIANNVKLVIQADEGFTPTPVISRLIIEHNNQNSGQADGLIITPSHNPPADGGIKYNPPHGGPAAGKVTQVIEQRANEILANDLKEVRTIAYADAINSPELIKQDFASLYIEQLAQVIDMQAIAEAGVSIGVDPLGGSGIHYWPKIAEKYRLNIEVVNPVIDAAFAFMPLDKDGKIRMDCSSPYAMSGLIKLKERFDIAIGNDPDFDRHGIVCQSGGLMNPNHYLAVAINYLMTHRQWPNDAKVGKTLVSSSLIDRVAKALGKPVAEVPVGFKWFVDGLQQGKLAFAGEESAGASFLSKDGSCWTTDKDGFVLGLLAAEMLATTGKDPHQHYLALTDSLGEPHYARVEARANSQQKSILVNLQPNDITIDILAGERIEQVINHAPGNNAAIGGLKVTTKNGWFAARSSGTEDVYKIYAESFLGTAHLAQIIEQAKTLIRNLFDAKTKGE